MGTKCPHKDGNIRNSCPSGDIYWSPLVKCLIKKSFFVFVCLFDLKMQMYSVMGRFRIRG